MSANVADEVDPDAARTFVMYVPVKAQRAQVALELAPEKGS